MFNKSINVNNFSALEELVNSNIELIVVGPEDPLVNGINTISNIQEKYLAPQKRVPSLRVQKYFQKIYV